LTNLGLARYASRRCFFMNRGIEPTLRSEPSATERSLSLFRAAARERPIGASAGLVVEYAMFASAVGLALTLFATRVPMRALDRTLGLRTRERFVELLARVSPG
jgi:hypothetical protein